MTSFSFVRQAFRRMVGLMIGARPEQPLYFERQIESAGKYGEIRALPLIPLDSPQILDTASTSFGDFYFMPGFDKPGGGKPLRPSP